MEAVDADDRHEHDPAHAGALALLLQVAGRGGEELDGRLLVGRRGRGGVDDALDSVEGLRETGSRDDVHALGARDLDDLVAGGFEDLDGRAADPPGGSGDSILLSLLSFVTSVGFAASVH